MYRPSSVAGVLCSKSRECLKSKNPKSRDYSTSKVFQYALKVTLSIGALTDLNIEFCTGMEVDLDMRLCWLSIDCWCLALRRSFCSLRSFRVEANNPPKPLELLLSPRLDGGASLPVSSSTPETTNHVLKNSHNFKITNFDHTCCQQNIF